MKPVLVMLVVVLVLGGCAMPEPIPLVRDIGVTAPEGDGGWDVVDARADVSIHLDAPSRDLTTLSPAGDGGDGGGDGVKDGLKPDGSKPDGMLDGTVEGGGKKDVWNNKPKG